MDDDQIWTSQRSINPRKGTETFDFPIALGVGQRVREASIPVRGRRQCTGTLWVTSFSPVREASIPVRGRRHSYDPNYHHPIFGVREASIPVRGRRRNGGRSSPLRRTLVREASIPVRGRRPMSQCMVSSLLLWWVREASIPVRGRRQDLVFDDRNPPAAASEKHQSP